jgi:hypothetical protein
MQFIIGSKDGRRRNVLMRASTIVHKDEHGNEHVISQAYNPYTGQHLRMDQVLCDVECEPNRWFVQVIRKSRIQGD